MSNGESQDHQHQRATAERLIARLSCGQISRREFVQRATQLGFSGTAISLFLVACRSATTPPTAPATPSTTTATSTTVANIPATVAPNRTATRATGSPVASVTRAASPAATPTISTAPMTTPQGTLLGGEIPPTATLADKQELRYPFVELTHADPGQATAIFEVQFIRNCWDGLVLANQQGEIVPGHATSYDISSDGLTYTFTLRAGLKFSDGSPLKAQDYEWTWKRNLHPDTASEYASALYPIKGARDYNEGKSSDPATVGVKATNDITLVVTLAAPAPYFLALASTWTYVPLQAAALEKYKAKWVEAGNMVTAGKYRLQEWAHDQRMVLVADPNYYGEKPTLQQITFQIYQDITTASLPAYQRGEIDIVNSLSPENLQRIKGDSTLRQEFNQLPVSGTGFLIFDTGNTKSIVAKPEFRQAVYVALNRDNLCNVVLKGQFLPKATLVPKGILGYLEQGPLVVDMKGDKAKARQLLQTAGYSGQEIVYTHTDTATAKAIAQAIQADLKEAGIAIRLEQLDRKGFSAWRDARRDQPFELYTGAWFSDYEDPQNWYHAFFGSGDQDFWHCRYPQQEAGKQFVALLRRAQELTARAPRQAAYEQAEKQLLTDLPLVPLYNNTDIILVKPYVKGLIHTNLGQDLFGGVKILKH